MACAGAWTPCWPARSWSWRRCSAPRCGGRSRQAGCGSGHALPRDGLVGLGILVAFAGMLMTILGTLAIAMRLDRAWKIVRRAGGYEQKDGMLERIFVISMAHRRHCVRDLVPGDPGAGLRHRAAVGLGTRLGPARLLPPVRRHRRVGGQQDAARAARAGEGARRSSTCPHSTCRAPNGRSCQTPRS